MEPVAVKPYHAYMAVEDILCLATTENLSNKFKLERYNLVCAGSVCLALPRLKEA